MLRRWRSPRECAEHGDRRASRAFIAGRTSAWRRSRIGSVTAGPVSRPDRRAKRVQALAGHQLLELLEGLGQHLERHDREGDAVAELGVEVAPVAVVGDLGVPSPWSTSS